jgi:predicted  nucleic acid-binding Zn-ribbon protein
MKNEKEVQELLQLQKKIEQAKEEKARIEGELKSLLKRLAEDFGSDNIPDIEKRIEGMRAQAAKMRKQIQDGLVVLRKEMEE